MPDFKETENVELQPLDANLSHGFFVTTKKFPPEEMNEDDEGRIPYGTTVSGVDVIGRKIRDINNRKLKDGHVIVDDLIQGTPTVNNNMVVVKLSYPAENTFGYYSLTFEIFVSDESNQELNFNRIIVLDK